MNCASEATLQFVPMLSIVCCAQSPTTVGTMTVAREACHFEGWIASVRASFCCVLGRR
jgi:hypothetical protein